MPAVWQPRVRGAVVKGAAFVAAGTLAEAFLRRLVRRALAGKSGQSAAPAGRTDVAPVGDPAGDDGHFISETLLLRHIRIRR